jgi:hypothetical protein
MVAERQRIAPHLEAEPDKHRPIAVPCAAT